MSSSPSTFWNEFYSLFLSYSTTFTLLASLFLSFDILGFDSVFWKTLLKSGSSLFSSSSTDKSRIVYFVLGYEICVSSKILANASFVDIYPTLTLSEQFYSIYPEADLNTTSFLVKYLLIDRRIFDSFSDYLYFRYKKNKTKRRSIEMNMIVKFS